MIGKIKENSLKKTISGGMDRSPLMLNQVQGYKKILFVSEKEKESFKSTVQKYFPQAHVHHLHLREIKVDNTIGHNYSVHESDFNLTGKLKNDKLKNLCEDSFDLIIDLSNNSLLLNYFLHEIPAKLIVGKLNAKNADLHDLFIEGNQDDEAFLENITIQLKKLTQNENRAI